jgi:hypothetical protein
MKKILYTLLIFHCSLIIGFAQVQQEWVRRYPDTSTGNAFTAGAYALALDDSGNVYITGSAGSYSFSAYCTIRYSRTGVQQWVAFYYGSNYGGLYANAIALDEYSNVYITGYSNNPASYFDYCTIKYNSSGVQQWVKYYDDPYNGEDEAEKIAVDNAGNIYVSGYSQVTSGGALAYTTIKYSTDGRELWVRTYPLTTSINYVNGIKIDDSCNVYITGDYGTKAVTVKYDSSGNQLWEREYTGSEIGRNGANSIALDRINNVYITGFSQGIPPRQSEYFTIKYSGSGVQEWVRRYNTDSTTQSRYVANAIAVDLIGNIFVNGRFEQDQGSGRKFCTLKYTNSGDLIWVQKDTATLSNQSTYMDIDSKSNVYIDGSYGITYAPYVTIKYDSSGVQQWKQFYQFELGDSYPYSLLVDKEFNVFLTGSSGISMCTIKYSQLVGIVHNNKQIPGHFVLYQNYPNPFNPYTVISYQLPLTNNVQLIIYDILGREVKTLVNEKQNAGSYQIEFDGSNYPSGIYFYRIEAGNFVESKKMMLVK